MKDQIRIRANELNYYTPHVRKFLMIAFFVAGGSFSGLPQQYIVILNTDSLQKILSKAKDTQRVNVLNMLVRGYLYPVRTQNISPFTQYDAQKYINEALPLARKLNYGKGIGNAILNEGILYLNKEQFKESLSSFKTAMVLLKQAGDEYAQAACFENAAFSIHAIGENKTAISYYDSAQHLFMKCGDTGAAVYNMAWKGHCYFDLGNYREAYKIGYTAWNLTKQTDTFLQTFTLAHLANLFLGAGLPEITIRYLHQILLLHPEIRSQHQAPAPWPFSWALERGGEAFLQLNQVDSAFKIGEMMNIPFEKMDVTNHLFYGHLYLALNQYRKAFPHFQQGYLIAKRGNRLISWSNHARELGNTYLGLKDFKKAVYYSEEALEKATTINAVLEMKNAASTLAAIYDQTKNFERAYYYSKLYKSLNDSLASEEYKRKLSLIQVQNELEVQTQRAKLLDRENQLRQRELKRETFLKNVLIVGICFAAIFGLLIIRIIYARNRLNQKLKGIELRNTISRDLHDDVGSTLSSIRFLSSMALDDDKNEYRTQNALFSINESAQRMLEAMNDIIWSIQPQNDSLENVFVRMISFASDLLETKKIKLHWRVSDSIKHVQLGLAERHDLLLLFKEAMHNLAKYSEASEAAVSLDFQRPFLVLTIKDNGKGFDPEAQHTGNGLKNMESRAKKIGARYCLRSVLGQGTTISVQLKPT
jgi:two-component system, NarL family, sensor histidine kinase UhpB